MKQKLIRIAMSTMLVLFLGLTFGPALAPTAQAQTDDTLRPRDFFSLRLPLFRSTNENSFFNLLANVINFLLLIAGIIAFFYVLYGGFMYLTSGGDQTGAQKGRTMIANALIGIVIIFLSYALVNFFVNRLLAEGQNGPDAFTSGYAVPHDGPVAS
jgi:Zn-dependent protease with chaperone function